MAAFETTRVQTAFAGRVGQAFASMFGAVLAWNEARRTRAVLSQLTDRELLDIGLVRGDIHSIT